MAATSPRWLARSVANLKGLKNVLKIGRMCVPNTRSKLRVRNYSIEISMCTVSGTFTRMIWRKVLSSPATSMMRFLMRIS